MAPARLLSEEEGAGPQQPEQPEQTFLSTLFNFILVAAILMCQQPEVAAALCVALVSSVRLWFRNTMARLREIAFARRDSNSGGNFELLDSDRLTDSSSDSDDAPPTRGRARHAAPVVSRLHPKLSKFQARLDAARVDRQRQRGGDNAHRLDAPVDEGQEGRWEREELREAMAVEDSTTSSSREEDSHGTRSAPGRASTRGGARASSAAPALAPSWPQPLDRNPTVPVPAPRASRGATGARGGAAERRSPPPRPRSGSN